MEYKKLFQQAKKDKKLEALQTEYHKWEQEGEQIIGMLKSRNSIPSSQGDGQYNQYLFDTDDGLVKVALGSAADNDAGALMAIGGIYSVTYKGKQEIAKGRRMNVFEIVQIQAPPDGGVGGASDVPF